MNDQRSVTRWTSRDCMTIIIEQNKRKPIANFPGRLSNGNDETFSNFPVTLWFRLDKQ